MRGVLSQLSTSTAQPQRVLLLDLLHVHFSKASLMAGRSSLKFSLVTSTAMSAARAIVLCCLLLVLLLLLVRGEEHNRANCACVRLTE